MEQEDRVCSCSEAGFEIQKELLDSIPLLEAASVQRAWWALLSTKPFSPIPHQQYQFSLLNASEI